MGYYEKPSDYSYDQDEHKRKKRVDYGPINIYMIEVPDGYDGSYRPAVIQKFGGEKYRVFLSDGERSLDRAVEIIRKYVAHFGECSCGEIYLDFEEIPKEKKESFWQSLKDVLYLLFSK